MPIDYIDLIMRDRYLQDIEEIRALMQDIKQMEIILLWDSTGRSAKRKESKYSRFWRLLQTR